MRPIRIYGRKKGDKLILGMSPYVRMQLEKRPDADIEAEIHWREPTRRARANRYLWGVVYRLMAYEMGESAETVHEIEKMRHCAETVVDFVSGEEVKVPKSTAKLTIAEFSAYLEAVMRDGGEYLGITFPEPQSSEDWRDVPQTTAERT